MVVHMKAAEHIDHTMHPAIKRRKGTECYKAHRLRVPMLLQQAGINLYGCVVYKPQLFLELEDKLQSPMTDIDVQHSPFLQLFRSRHTISDNMSSNLSAPEVHYTFYTQPYLFFPRRIHAYLTAKPLPSNVKSSFELVTFDGKTGQMLDPPGKPAGSVPMLRIDSASEPTYIRQSIAIISYLEEVHPRAGASYAASDMNGSNPLERARVAEAISLTEEVGQALGFWAMNTSALYQQMGMTQSKEAGVAAKMRLHRCLQTLEDYCSGGVQGGKWIAETEGMTLADVALGSVVEYSRDMYGRDVLEGHEVLWKWFEKWERTEAGKPGREKDVPVEVRGPAQTRIWDEGSKEKTY